MSNTINRKLLPLFLLSSVFVVNCSKKDNSQKKPPSTSEAPEVAQNPPSLQQSQKCDELWQSEIKKRIPDTFVKYIHRMETKDQNEPMSKEVYIVKTTVLSSGPSEYTERIENFDEKGFVTNTGESSNSKVSFLESCLEPEDLQTNVTKSEGTEDITVLNKKITAHWEGTSWKDGTQSVETKEYKSKDKNNNNLVLKYYDSFQDGTFVTKTESEILETNRL